MNLAWVSDRAAARRSQRRAAPLAAVLAGLVIFAAGCGGGSPSHGSSGGSSSNGGSSNGSVGAPGGSSDTSAQNDRLAFAKCMRSHGISNFPDPSSAGGASTLPAGIDINSAQYQSAENACKHLLPNGGNPGTSPQGQQALLKFVNCMRSHGYPQFPDPTSNGDLNIPSNVDPQSPQFQRAQQACQQYLPSLGGA